MIKSINKFSFLDIQIVILLYYRYVYNFSFLILQLFPLQVVDDIVLPHDLSVDSNLNMMKFKVCIGDLTSSNVLI